MQESQKHWLNGLKSALKRSRATIIEPLSEVFSRKRIDDRFWEDTEDILIQGDVGVPTALKIIEGLKADLKESPLRDTAEMPERLKKTIIGILEQERIPPVSTGSPLTVKIIVGVNGAGKTTSIAKLAHKFSESGSRVLIAAADTYRAAAIEQVQIWADRIGVDVVKHERGSDAAAVVYDAVHAAKARGADILIIDTAGRLHTKVPLMEEIRKVKRVVEREMQGAQIETLLVIDATTGQNGLSQAKLFNDALDLNGIILAKLDGTAKGGIILAIIDALGIPVRYIGTGERVEDLAEFEAHAFVDALLS
jgi:fused signal recognition particle receptor